MEFVPVNEPLFDGNEKAYLSECIESGWVSSEGPFVQKFEEAFATKVNRKYGITVSNGTVALELAMQVLDIEKGSEVIMPTFTIISCALAVIRAGLVPVLIDSDINTWNMDVAQIEESITSKTKAIMVVHIYGLPVDMDPVIKIAKKYNLKIIEDAAEMHGQTYKGLPCGSFGDISVFSFYPNKHITTGEGGIILTNDFEIAKRCKNMRNLCHSEEKRFVHHELGYNYRMTNLQAALGLAQLEKLDEHIELKRKMGMWYTEFLSDFGGITLPVRKTEYADNIYWVFGVLLEDHLKMSVEYIMTMLKKDNIGTRPFFYPMHMQPVFKKMNLFPNRIYPVAEYLTNRGFYLPSGLGTINHEQISHISNALKTTLMRG